MIGVGKAQASGLRLDALSKIKAAVSALMMQADFSQSPFVARKTTLWPRAIQASPRRSRP
jgi:hypothetical protein